MRRMPGNLAMSTIQYSVAELAERFTLEFKGDGARVIDGVGTLAGAGPVN